MANIFDTLYPDAILRRREVRNQAPTAFPIPRPDIINQAPVLPMPRPDNLMMPPMPMARPDNLIPQSSVPPLSDSSSNMTGLGDAFTGVFGTSFNDPRTQGILGAASQLLKGGAPSFTPTSLGGNLGSALDAGLRGFSAAQERQDKLDAREQARQDRLNRSRLQVVGGALVDTTDPSNPKIVYESTKAPKTGVLGKGKYIYTQDPKTGAIDIKKSSVFDEINKMEQEKSGGIGTLTEGQKSVDKAFAKEYGKFVIEGGFADTEKGLSQLDEAVGILSSGENVTGSFISRLPFQDTFNPEGVKAKEYVEEVVQRNLRLILGAAFTEKEGDKLISRAFNPKLSEKENIARIKRLSTSMKKALRQKQQAAQYFEKNGTLKGFEGTVKITTDQIIDDAGLRTKNVKYKVEK